MVGEHFPVAASGWSWELAALFRRSSVLTGPGRLPALSANECHLPGLCHRHLPSQQRLHVRLFVPITPRGWHTRWLNGLNEWTNPLLRRNMQRGQRSLFHSSHSTMSRTRTFDCLFASIIQPMDGTRESSFWVRRWNKVLSSCKVLKNSEGPDLTSS